MFALLLIDHPLWNHILRPVVLDEKGKSYPISYFPTKTNSIKEELSDLQRKAVEAYESMREPHILKLFVREKLTVTEFQKKFAPNFPNYELIIQTVERANFKLANLARQYGIPIFHKDKSFSTLYESDRVYTNSDFDKTTTRFLMEDGVLHYSLLLNEKDGLKPIIQKYQTKDLFVLSKEPACYILHNRLYIFSQNNFKRISTFLNKDNVEVPTKNLKTYLDTFVKKAIEQEDNIIIEGLPLKESYNEPHPILTLVESLDRTPAIRLNFQYGDFCIEIDAKKKRLVNISEEINSCKITIENRNRDSEQRYIDLIKNLGLYEINKYFFLDLNKTKEVSIVNFLICNKEALKEFEIRQELSEYAFILEPLSFHAEITELDMDWFELQGEVSVGDLHIPFIKLRNHIVSGERIYKVEDGRSIILPEEIFSKYSDLMQRTTKDDSLKIRRSLLGLMSDSFSQSKAIRLTLEEPEIVPKDINATLREYQTIGYSWLVKLYQMNYGGCLADDMGLGKTLQFLSFLRRIYPQRKVQKEVYKQPQWIYESNEPTFFDQPITDSLQTQKPDVRTEADKEENKAPTLIVVPSSLVFNWVNEKKKFAPSLTHYVHTGDRRIQSSQIGKIFAHYNLIFTTYGILRKDINFLKECEFECAIFDESQNLKNPSSLTYKAVMQLNARHVFCVTGTPIENGMTDLWAQMNLCNRDILGTLHYFHNYFEQPIQKEKDAQRESLLRAIIKPFLLRRTKKEVAKDLPDKYTMEVFCEMSEDHKSYYETQKNAVRNTLMDEILRFGKPQTMTMALSSLTMLRQLANQVSLVDELSDIPSNKVDEIVRRLKSLKEEGHKVLVFSSFVRFLEIIEKALNEEGFRYSKVTGATQDRETQVHQFQNDPDIFCFLISLKAGGVGLNLTAADYVFLIDPWWNPAAEQQAEDRAYRIGQMRNVFVYRFIMKGTVEEKVLLLQEKKRNIADTFIGQNNPFDTLNIDDWKALLQ